MRALWLVRSNLTRHTGGDTTQILRTADALRSLGVEVDLHEGRCPALARYDVVHLWHLDRLWENLGHCRRIRAEHKPSVLSTIYWPGEEYDRGARRGLQGVLARTFGSGAYRGLRVIQRWGMQCILEPGSSYWSCPPVGFRGALWEVLDTVAFVLPNSQAEHRAIERQFERQVRAVIVPNAASESFGPPVLESDPARQGVVCVGRIEPRKNQLALIRALRGTELGVRLVGRPGRFNRGYYRSCVREAGANIKFLGQLTPEEVRELLRRSTVHINVSWYETPGLASLEAALCGCAIVATEGGCTREYLQDEAYYCRPDDTDSIRRAVLAALEGGARPALARRVAEQYTWRAAAEKTLEAYQLATAAAQDFQ